MVLGGTPDKQFLRSCQDLSMLQQKLGVFFFLLLFFFSLNDCK